MKKCETGQFTAGDEAYRELLRAANVSEEDIEKLVERRRTQPQEARDENPQEGRNLFEKIGRIARRNGTRADVVPQVVNTLTQGAQPVEPITDLTEAIVHTAATRALFIGRRERVAIPITPETQDVVVFRGRGRGEA